MGEEGLPSLQAAELQTWRTLFSVSFSHWVLRLQSKLWFLLAALSSVPRALSSGPVRCSNPNLRQAAGLRRKARAGSSVLFTVSPAQSSSWPAHPGRRPGSCATRLCHPTWAVSKDSVISGLANLTWAWSANTCACLMRHFLQRPVATGHMWYGSHLLMPTNPYPAYPTAPSPGPGQRK